MSDIIGAVGGTAMGATALGYGIKFLHTVIGPGAANLGEVYRDWQDYRLRNWLKIGEAAERLGAAELGGSVNLRVAQRALDDSTMLSDPVMQAYAAGVLVGAKSDDREDDEALPVLDLLNQLTRRETTLHFQVYAALHRAARAEDFPQEQWAEVEVELPLMPVLEELKIPAIDDGSETASILRVLAGLARQSLIDPNRGYGAVVRDRTLNSGPLEDFVVYCRPTIQGMTLHAWAHGVKDGAPRQLLRRDLPDIGIPTLGGTSVFLKH
ncbi:hypothetical protein [Rathayibacter festucae]|uniref:hypothetical protein n=1 Tax=Rathayibacter festucae TaxID=110937 RepID=UPI000FD9D145|nr:hypothetical protein [Rathayibacter festucae]